MKGFTLLEILIVLSIMMMLIFFALPAQIMDKTQAQLMGEQLMQAIHLTRHEAMMRNDLVTLCQSVDLKTCSGEWRDGYIIKTNDNVLYTFQQERKGSLYWRVFPKNQKYVTFLPSGLPSAENGTFWYCPPSTENPVWAIAMSQSGRVRLIHPDQAGKIRDDKGEPLRC